MATRDEVKAAIVEVTGAPTSGLLADIDRIVDAVMALDKPVRYEMSRETRTVKASESR